MTQASDHEAPLILVDASVEEITEALRDDLPTEDFAKLTVSMIPDPEEAILGSRRGADEASVLVAAVQFIGLAVASGYTHDLFKAAVSALRRRLGEDRLFPRPAPEAKESETADPDAD